jgi:lysozyme
MFTYNWENLEKERMIRGAYHFFESDDDPEKQAEWFVKNVASFANALPPVIDAERAGHGDITVKEYRDKLMKCLNHIEKLTGKKSILYSCPNFAKKYLGSQEFGKYKLWIADYDVDQPTVPKIWENNGWAFWQNSFQTTVPGVPAEVDRNVFANKFHKLLEMIE